MVRMIVASFQRFVKFGRRPSVCPYCGSTNISGGRGHWDCDDCGKSGSY